MPQRRSPFTAARGTDSTNQQLTVKRRDRVAPGWRIIDTLSFKPRHIGGQGGADALSSIESFEPAKS